MFKLELSEQMVMVIINALGNHAYREAAPVIAELHKQVNNQRISMPPSNGKAEQTFEKRE